METTTSFPPGPKSVFGLEGLAFRRDTLGFLTRLARRYGDIAHFRVGAQHFFLLNHPDHIRDVLVTNYGNFGRSVFIERAKRLLGEGLLRSVGEHHRRQRRLIQPAFHRQRIAALASMIVDGGEKFAARWRHGETREMLPEMRRLSLAVLARALFGVDAEGSDGGDNEELTDAIKRLYLFGGRSNWQTALLRKLRLVDPHRFERACERLDAFTYRLIGERRLRGIDGGDVLSTLLMARDASGGMSDEEVRDEVTTLIEAGHVTTASALTWAWYLLAHHPEAEAKLHRELDDALGGRAPTFEDVARLPYTDMVLLETMRMYPPAWIIGRRVLKDYAVGGYVLPTGSFILMSPYVMHYDPRYYVEPHRFDPERWTPEARESRPQFSYFPFGGGHHRCIGEGLALLEGVLLLATLASRWRPRLAAKRPPKPVALVGVMIPSEMPMRLERRDDHPTKGLSDVL